MLTHSLKGDTALYLHVITPTEYSKSTGIYLYGSYNDIRISHDGIVRRVEDRFNVEMKALGQKAWDEFEKELMITKQKIWIEKLHALMGQRFD